MNMKTISLVNQKGGVGKTTLALHIATAFHSAGFATVILDLDPQASSTEWHDARGEESLPYVESVVPARLERAIKTSKEIGTDLLILDTAPHAEVTALEASQAADLILTPSKPGIMDIRALRKTAKMLKLAAKPAFVVLNEIPPQGDDADEAEAAIRTDKDIRMEVCPIRLIKRKAYSRSLILGQTAQEFAPSDKAAEEVEQLHMWVRSQLNI
jgi:chromosome partitioning protein